MGRAQSAYYLLGVELSEYSQKLMAFPQSPYWIHETVVSNFIGLPTGAGEHGQSEALTSLLDCLKKGFGGNQKKKTYAITGLPAIDLRVQANGTGVFYDQFGRTEQFPRGKLSDEKRSHKPRWFHFGEDCPLELGRQLDIVEDLVGDRPTGNVDSGDPAVIPLYVKRRRERLHKKFFAKDRTKCMPYTNWDVPSIAAKWIDTWADISITQQSRKSICRRSFSPQDLDFIENDFRNMMIASNKIGKFVARGEQLVAHLSTRSSPRRSNIAVHESDGRRDGDRYSRASNNGDCHAGRDRTGCGEGDGVGRASNKGGLRAGHGRDGQGDGDRALNNGDRDGRSTNNEGRASNDRDRRSGRGCEGEGDGDHDGERLTCHQSVSHGDGNRYGRVSNDGVCDGGGEGDRYDHASNNGDCRAGGDREGRGEGDHVGRALNNGDRRAGRHEGRGDSDRDDHASNHGDRHAGRDHAGQGDGGARRDLEGSDVVRRAGRDRDACGDDDQRNSGPATKKSRYGSFPDCLRLQNLRCNEEGIIMWDIVSEVASLEYLFHLVSVEEVSAEDLCQRMDTDGVKWPSNLDIEDVENMSRKGIANARLNMKQARMDLMDSMCGFFVPKEGDHLVNWLKDGLAYSDGLRLEAKNFVLNPNSRRLMLSFPARFILREIMFAFNISIYKMGALWSAFYALTMRRVIPKHAFICASALWSNIMSLSHIDNACQTKQFIRKIRKRTKHGFRVYVYISADDSKHFKRNQHVHNVTDFDVDDENLSYLPVPFQPNYRLVSSAPNEVKADNYLKNANDLIDLLGVEGAAYVGGGVNDNAADAIRELHNTFDEIMRRCEGHPDPKVQELVCVNGVRRRTVVMGDPYHWANLGVMYASKGMSGDTVNAEHEQCHHRQLLMSMHSLHSDDSAYSQKMMDRVMEGTETFVRIKTWRERQQRWLVNQRYALYIVSLLGTLTNERVVCLVAWALFFANFSRSDWKRRVGKEIATWLSMPAIVLGLHFEAELGNYFEQSYSWHNRKGPFHKRSGFRMMEMYDYYWDLEIPWWNHAVDDPLDCMPNTMEYLAKHFVGEELERRRTLIERGLKAGREEVIKMTKRYLLKPPLTLLMLTNRKSGPSFVRAVLSVLHEYKTRVPDDVCLINDVGDSWGRYVYEEPSERPNDERQWYDLLTSSDDTVNDLLHFWRQFCLNWPVVTEDLQTLSRAQDNDSVVEDEEPVLAIFSNQYKVLFECLYAVFGAMMSNSRLCEQIHGMMRHGLRAQTGMAQADHQRQYSVTTMYDMREERRLLGDGDGTTRESGKKALRHDRTKLQCVHYTTQLCRYSESYDKGTMSVLDKEELTSVRTVHFLGRRTLDASNLDTQIAYEDARASRLTRAKLSVDAVQTLAGSTRPTNDAMHMFNVVVLLWRDKVADMVKGTYWDKLRPKKEFKQTWRIARKSLIWITKYGIPPTAMIKNVNGVRVKTYNFKNWPWKKVNTFNWGEMDRPWQLYEKGSIYGSMTSFGSVKPFIAAYLRMTNRVVNLIFELIQNDGGFEDKSVKKEDIRFLFVRYVEEAWEEDLIEPAEEALVGARREVDSHFRYVSAREDSIIVDDDSIGDCHNEGGGSGGIEDIQTEDSMADID